MTRAPRWRGASVAVVLVTLWLACPAQAQAVPRHAPSGDLDLPAPVVEQERPPFAGVDPSGVWFHAWSGSTAGTGWVLALAEEPGALYLADVRGEGVRVAIDGQGVITSREPVPGDGADGRLVSPDHAVLDWRKHGLTFSSMLMRVPFVPPDFPLALESPCAGDETLAGAWRGVVTDLSPTTGEVLGRIEVEVRLSVGGDTLLLTRPDGSWDRGLFETPTRVVFRVCDAIPADERFRTVTGAGTSRGVDVVGEARVLGRNLLEVLLLLQTRDEVGDQRQHALRYELRRADALQYGDVDGDGRLGDIDRGLIEAALGATEADDAFRIGMDLTGDRVVTEDDLQAWDAADDA